MTQSSWGQLDAQVDSLGSHGGGTVCLDANGSAVLTLAKATRRPNSWASAARRYAELLRASGVTIGASAMHRSA